LPCFRRRNDRQCAEYAGFRLCFCFGNAITEFGEQQRQFVVTAVNVTDDVERSRFGAPVVIEWLTGDNGGLDLLRRVQREDVSEAFTLQPAQRSAQVPNVIADHVRPESAVGPPLIALIAEALRHIEDDRNRQAVKLAGEGEQRFPCLRLHVRGIDDHEFSGSQSLRGDVVQHVEGVVRCRLIGLIIADQTSAEVRRKHLRCLKMTAGEGGFPRAGRADQHDDRELWQCDFNERVRS